MNVGDEINPQIINEKPQRVTVWYALWSGGIIDLEFLEMLLMELLMKMVFAIVRWKLNSISLNDGAIPHWKKKIVLSGDSYIKSIQH